MPKGKRLFQRWLVRPLRHTPAINARLDAIDDLKQLPALLGMTLSSRNQQLYDATCRRQSPAGHVSRCSLAGAMRKRLGALPDLERILSRIHAANCKLTDFLSALGGFRAGQVLRDQMHHCCWLATSAQVKCLECCALAIGRAF